MKTRSYTELSKLKTFYERFEYLKLDGNVGDKIFGLDRYLNQQFYRSAEWKRVRRDVILRDNGWDLGVEGCTIIGHIYVHHMNPILPYDLENRTPKLLDPENLITISYNTHQAITFGLDNTDNQPIDRTPNDTCPWK